jgi:hypothetical protein
MTWSGTVLNGVALASPLPSEDFGPLGMAAVWFTGQLLLAGQPAPQGTQITIEAQNASGQTQACGQATVVDGQGEYDAYVNAATGCATTATKQNVGPYLFTVNGSADREQHDDAQPRRAMDARPSVAGRPQRLSAGYAGCSAA